MSGAPVPTDLLDRLHTAGGDVEAGRRIGVDHTLRVCQGLLDGGAPGLHFYTMNQAASTLEVCQALGWTPRLSDELPASPSVRPASGRAGQSSL